MMDKKDRDILELELEKEITRVKDDIKSYKKLVVPISPDNAIGRISRMEAINSKSINEAALQKSEILLIKLEKALDMIDDPDFGLCIVCEESIPVARLKILPGTEYCVSCAGKL